MAARKKKLIDDIPKIPVPAEMWDEMLGRAGGDPKLAKWIWSCWKYNERSDDPNPLEK